jgi:flagellin-like hook-associated protein FlgL
VSYNGTNATFVVGTDGNTIDSLINWINANATLQGAGAPNGYRAKASLVNGRLLIESQTGEDVQVAAADGTGGAGSAAPPAVSLFGTPTGLPATWTSPDSFNATRTSLASQFESLKEQIDQQIKDTGYNGVNLLNGDILKVLFNETNTTFTNIQGVVFNSQGLGLAITNGITSADSARSWQSDNEISDALAKLDTALNKVRTQASNFGSHLVVLQTRQDFTKTSILTLNAGSDLLVLADGNEEGANLLALQTRQQLSTTALTLSAQADTAVLRLFGF